MSDDKQKIVWKKSSASTSQNNDVNKNSHERIFDDDTLIDLSQRHALQKTQNKTEVPSETIDSLKEDIEKMLQEIETSDSAGIQEKREESPKESAAVGAALAAISEKKQEKQEKQEEEVSIDSIRESIQQELTSSQKQEGVIEKQTEKLLKEKEKKRGVEQTYYSDLSQAMGANRPETMSELLQKAKFEKQEKEIFSFKSKKNLLYIMGSILLFIGVIFIGGLLLKKPKEVRYITSKRVPALVYSDKDTGITLNKTEKEKAKQAIRKVIEMKIPDDSIHQIYYASRDNLGNVRRIGLKQVFDITDVHPPKLLYDNVENEFMHGVYRTDKNHPFLILKALSYDRAFEGMKEWEPTMIDDLATYLDLPKEAGDRSLLESGFSDDLIKNKNVRVARFLPREIDKKGGVFDFLDKKNSEESKISFFHKKINTFKRMLAGFIVHGSQHVYAQVAPTTSKGEKNICYESQKECKSTKQTCYKNGVIVPYNENDSDIVCRYEYQIVPYDPQSTDQLCSDILVPNGQVIRKGENGFELALTSPNFSCRHVVDANGSFDNIPEEKFVCFDIQTGNKLENSEAVPEYEKWCFETYQCRAFICRDRSGQTVHVSKQGQPGIQCGSGPIIPMDQVDTFQGQKICRSYPELLNIQNINDKNICFDQDGNYIEGYSPASPGGYLPSEINCIVPVNRRVTMCVTIDNKVEVNDPNKPDGYYKFCFQPLDGSTSNIDEQFQEDTEELKQKAAMIGYEIKAIAVLMHLAFPNLQIEVGGNTLDVAQTLNDTSNLFLEYSYGNILEEKFARDAVGVARNLEIILNYLDPDGTANENENGKLTLIGRLRRVIDFIKRMLGMSHNVAWTTFGNRWPNGIPLPEGGVIYAGQSIETVEPVQQALSLIGLMDPISVNGQLDLVTQDAISTFQSLNGIPQTGVIDTTTINVLNNIIAGQGSLYGGATAASIDDYFNNQNIGVGSYNTDVQNLQMILYAEGYDVTDIDGLFDSDLCTALMKYQEDNNLEISDASAGCMLNASTLESLNNLIKGKGYLGSGFSLNANGYLQGTHVFEGKLGPGVVDFGVNQAEADSLKEGDIVLMYTFLDEKTILITRHESVIDEIIKRRALNDIFNKDTKTMETN